MSTRAQGDLSVLSVSNSGQEVQSGDVERLFQPFQRLDGARSGQGQGHGLGLAIVKAVAVAHNATITTRARPEGGLAVEVSFRATVPVPDEETGVERQLEPATG